MGKKVTICLMCLAVSLLFADGPYDLIEVTPQTYKEPLLLPNQIATCDCIFIGTVVTNISKNSSVFTVEETIYGPSITTNIAVESIGDFEATPLKQDAKYLIFAYTNNWGYFKDTGDEYFFCMLGARRDEILTNAPPEYGFFNGYRTLSLGKSVIDFSTFTENGTNFWDYYRTFITNHVEILKKKHDSDLCFREIESLLKDHGRSIRLPRWLKHDLLLYHVWESIDREQRRLWREKKARERGAVVNSPK